MNWKLSSSLLVVLAVVAVILFSQWSPESQPLGASFNQDKGLPQVASKFTNISSASQKDLVLRGRGRVFSFIVTSDSQSLRYFQLFDSRTLPSLASASLTPILSIPIAPAAASTSPTIVRVNSTEFAPAIKFNNGLFYAISSAFATYASSSVKTDRHKTTIFYEDLSQ